jgi:hypothetical protein
MSVKATSTYSNRNIINSKSDIWLAGGLSILVLGALSLFGLLGSTDLLLQNFLVLTVLLNGTHFMASYRLLYSSRAYAAKYPWASFYLPGILLAYSVAAVIICRSYDGVTAPLDLLTIVATLYLALHYTGQAWGVTSTFAALEGVRFEPDERVVLRRFLRFMAFWHVVWGAKILWPPAAEYSSYVRVIDVILNCGAAVSLFGGLLCFWRMGKRLGRPVPMRVVTPYLALHTWYAFLYVFPQSLFWVQIFHALQYLPFPLRVELNRAHGYEDTSEAKNWRVMLGYSVALILTSALIFAVIPKIAQWSTNGTNSFWLAIAACINIHHYFIDGCIWHISNPVVSKELFAHTRKGER